MEAFKKLEQDGLEKFSPEWFDAYNQISPKAVTATWTSAKIATPLGLTFGGMSSGVNQDGIQHLTGTFKPR